MSFVYFGLRIIGSKADELEIKAVLSLQASHSSILSLIQICLCKLFEQQWTQIFLQTKKAVIIASFLSLSAHSS